MKNVIIVAGALAALAGMASAAGSTFATATPSNGGGVVSGALVAGVLGPETLYQHLSNQVRAQPTITTHNFSGMTGGLAFRCELNQADNGAPTWDSYARARRSDNSVITVDDDSGPGLFSQLSGSVPADGIINVDVTGFSDPNFTGLTGAQGQYDVDMYQTSLLVAGVSMQWWRFNNLTPNQPLSAQVIASSTVNYDTYFKVYNSAGTLIGTADDGGAPPNGFWSVFNGTVPADGIIYLGVTHFNSNSQMSPTASNNVTFAGPSGSFDISVTPAPGALALLGLGGLIAGRRRR